MKKFLFRLIAMAIFFCAFNKTQAQVEVTYGPELAGSFVGMVDDGEVIYAGVDGQLGGAVHVQIGRFFAVRPTVFFKSATMIDAYDESYKLKMMRAGINLPLLFSYNFERGAKVYVGAGPSLMYHISGSYDDDYSGKTDIKFGTSEDDDMKPIDIGLHLKAGFQFAMGLSLNLYFTNSLVDLYPVKSYGSLKNMEALGISIGWMFGGRRDD